MVEGAANYFHYSLFSFFIICYVFFIYNNFLLFYHVRPARPTQFHFWLREKLFLDFPATSGRRGIQSYLDHPCSRAKIDQGFNMWQDRPHSQNYLNSETENLLNHMLPDQYIHITWIIHDEYTPLHQTSPL